MIPQPSNFFHPPPRHWKTWQVPPGRQKSLITPICCTCLTVRLMLISEQLIKILIPSYFYWLVWNSSTKMLQNKTLIGCLANTGQDQHFEVEPLRSYFIFEVEPPKSFLTRNISLQANIYDKNPLSPSRYSLFFLTSFENLGLKVIPTAERVADTMGAF